MKAAYGERLLKKMKDGRCLQATRPCEVLAAWRGLKLTFNRSGFDQVSKKEVAVNSEHGDRSESNNVDGVNEHGE
jgi:hypothetical protein